MQYFPQISSPLNRYTVFHICCSFEIFVQIIAKMCNFRFLKCKVKILAYLWKYLNHIICFIIIPQENICAIISCIIKSYFFFLSKYSKLFNFTVSRLYKTTVNWLLVIKIFLTLFASVVKKKEKDILSNEIFIGLKSPNIFWTRCSDYFNIKTFVQLSKKY